MRQPSFLHPIHTDLRAIVTIPAYNEAADIERCLAALAMQRDEAGAPVPAGAFEILILANNCTDATAKVARTFSALVPHPVTVVAEQLPPISAAPAARASGRWIWRPRCFRSAATA